ncbi:glycosyltransferase [Bradyrhizobium sp. WYCCWR 12699]|uniref:glycosyltransferase n=1 Tax=Bradyrhizobium sp. WYCCWR 12699 TaxID=3064203 RepID=UPI0028A479D7|nr:glycosyltransferase [Bradyrhizobium sp. WYCCWR 12699]MDT4740721.1 glycosyltransferase [Bradyrhizobium sp. WYCCWR 12699]
MMPQSDKSSTQDELLSNRKRELLQHVESTADVQEDWRKLNSAYYESDRSFVRFLIPSGQRVLEVGCGRGDLLSALEPSHGVGIDFSPTMIAKARGRHPHLTFVCEDVEQPGAFEKLEGTFDYILIADTIGMLEDIDGTLRALHRVCSPSTRLVIAYYSPLWEPILKLGELVRLKSRQPGINYLSGADFINMMDLADFEVLKLERKQLLPRSLLGFGTFVNRFIAPLPGIRALCLRTYVVGRPIKRNLDRSLSASVLIPCRNEKGNVENAVRRMPKFGLRQELIFVEGNSTDGTYEECLRVQDTYKDQWDIKVFKQDGKGKGDAVRKGFAAASCDVLMILDADLTMPPEDLPKYHFAIESGKAEFVNGTRLVYPMEDEAMRPLNLLANRLFAWLFTFLVNTRLTDTLCGTKALLRSDYEELARNRSYFGEFDPFGDFDLIFGAAKHNLKIIEVPIKYRARTFGETQISRFRDGWLLFKMVWFAYRKLKAI